MGHIILTCGHSIEDYDDAHSVTTKDYDRRGHRAVSYKMVCKTCRDNYEAEAELFYTDDEAMSWLLGRT